MNPVIFKQGMETRSDPNVLGAQVLVDNTMLVNASKLLKQLISDLTYLCIGKMRP